MLNLILSLSLFAQTQMLTLRGVDKESGKFCYLYVHTENFQPYSTKVTTSYSHEDDKPLPFLLKMAPNRSDVLSGQSETNNDQLVVFLRTPNSRIGDAKNYNLKWKHGSHSHIESCLNLTLLSN
jgi:hypothetical protein